MLTNSCWFDQAREGVVSPLNLTLFERSIPLNPNHLICALFKSGFFDENRYSAIISAMSRGVTASNLDPESSDRDSNPREASQDFNAAFREWPNG